MGDVKRYDINAYLGEEGWMEEDRHGQYVEYTDYAKLEAALSSAPQGWRPIETAPKDGTEILLGSPGDEHEEAWTQPGYFCQWKTWNASRAYAPGAPDKTIKGMEQILFPTHWMPLPAAPATKSTIHRDSAPDGCKWVTETKEDK